MHRLALSALLPLAAALACASPPPGLPLARPNAFADLNLKLDGVKMASVRNGQYSVF